MVGSAGLERVGAGCIQLTGKHRRTTQLTKCEMRLSVVMGTVLDGTKNKAEAYQQHFGYIYRLSVFMGWSWRLVTKNKAEAYWQHSG